MSKIISLASWVQRYILYLIFPGMIWMRIIAWLKIDYTALYARYQESTEIAIQQDAMQLPFIGKLLYFVLESVPTVLLLLMLWYLIAILAFYKRGKLFTFEIYALVKKINFCMIAWAVYQLLFTTFASLCISFFKPVGKRYIMAKIDFDDLVHFFVVLLVCMLLYLMQEAYKIKVEQELVV